MHKQRRPLLEQCRAVGKGQQALAPAHLCSRALDLLLLARRHTGCQCVRAGLVRFDHHLLTVGKLSERVEASVTLSFVQNQTKSPESDNCL